MVREKEKWGTHSLWTKHERGRKKKKIFGVTGAS